MEVGGVRTKQCQSIPLKCYSGMLERVEAFVSRGRSQARRFPDGPRSNVSLSFSWEVLFSWKVQNIQCIAKKKKKTLSPEEGH